MKFPLIPRTVDIAITGRCNLDCKYCFYADEMTSLTDLPTPAWLRFFAELSELGVMSVCLSGGEPFARHDLFELVDGIVANRMRYNILSNGTLIDEHTIAEFEVGKRRLRLDYIQVSIDGSRAEVHDRSRPASFERALRGLKLLKRAGFPVTVRVTINRHNLDDLDNVAHLLLEEIGLPSFATNEAMPVGLGCQNAAEISLSAAEQAQAMATIGRLLERYPGQLNALAGPQAKREMYSEMEHARRTGEKPTRWAMGCLSGCGCVFSRVDVMHNGSIVPCHMLPSLALGNITRDSLREIWQTHPTLAALRERRAIAMHEVAGCGGCEWAPYCNGSCPGLAFQLTGDFNRANPTDCYQRFLKESGRNYVG